MDELKGLEKNDVIETDITSMGMEGEGVARVDGKAVFIRGAIRGERVRAKIIATRPKFDVGLLQSVISPSPDRAEPVCPVYGKCGGCDLQHLVYSAQLAFKRERVSDALKKIGGFDVPVEEVVPSELKYRYRNKISLPVRQINNQLKIGLFAKSSHRIVETPDCFLQPAWNAALAPALRGFMEKNRLVGYDEEKDSGDVRHIVAREAGGRLSITVVTTREIKTDGLKEAFAGVYPRVSVYLNINRKRSNVILGTKWIPVSLDPEPTIIDGYKTDVHPAGFFQVNDDVREKLYSYVADLCDGAVAIEAYSGAGLLSARLARKAERVYGIELNPQSHEAALKLCRDNNITNFTPVLGDVGEKLGEVLTATAAENENGGGSGNKETFIVLDPPRTGISAEAAAILAASGADNIVYVSCNPPTLARDARLIADGGYDLISVRPFDMFPETSNLETVAIFGRKL